MYLSPLSFTSLAENPCALQAVPFDVNKGLEAVKRICSEHNIQGMHGPVIQLFDCNPQLNMAIDATAGAPIISSLGPEENCCIPMLHVGNAVTKMAVN